MDVNKQPYSFSSHPFHIINLYFFTYVTHHISSISTISPIYTLSLSNLTYLNFLKHFLYDVPNNSFNIYLVSLISHNPRLCFLNLNCKSLSHNCTWPINFIYIYIYIYHQSYLFLLHLPCIILINYIYSICLTQTKSFILHQLYNYFYIKYLVSTISRLPSNFIVSCAMTIIYLNQLFYLL